PRQRRHVVAAGGRVVDREDGLAAGRRLLAVDRLEREADGVGRQGRERGHVGQRRRGRQQAGLRNRGQGDAVEAAGGGEVVGADVDAVGVQAQGRVVGEEVVGGGQDDGLPAGGRVGGVRPGDQDAVVGGLVGGDLDGEPPAAGAVVQDAGVAE